jgi:nitrogen regulatory protein PII-like uncharacterized protein
MAPTKRIRSELEENVENDSLKSVFRSYIDNTPMIVNDPKRLPLVLGTKSGDLLLRSVHMMKTLPSLKSVGRYLVPEEFDAFAITRDPKNNQRVLSLTDGATVIAGEELDAMLLKEFARKEDLKVLYKVPNPIGTQAYAFPRVVAEEKEIEIAKKKDEKVKLTMVHFL